MPPMAIRPLPVVAPTQYRDSGGVTCCSGAAFDAAFEPAFASLFGACARPEMPNETAMTGTAATTAANVVRMHSPFKRGSRVQFAPALRTGGGWRTGPCRTEWLRRVVS